MATYYYPLNVNITTTNSVIAGAPENDTRFKILIATGSTATNARNQITGGTSIYAENVGYLGSNKFYVTGAFSSAYFAVGVICPYCNYATTSGKSVSYATSSSSSYSDFNVAITAFSTLTSEKRLISKPMYEYIEDYASKPSALSSQSYTAMNSLNGVPYVTVGEIANTGYLFEFDLEHDESAYETWECLYFNEGNNQSNVSNNFVANTNDLYWSGTSITVYNQSVSTALTFSAFDVSATTTANTTVSIFHLASSQSVGAGSSKSVTVTHSASNPVVAASSVTLTLSCSGPAGWSGPVAVKDSKNLFNETANARTLTSTKYITANTSGGTVSVYMRPATRTITASTGISLRATNTTSMNIVITYLKIWAEDVTNGDGYQGIINVTGNPTIAAGASNVVLGKTISKTSYSGQHLKVTIQGYTDYAPTTVTFQASGSTGQNFGVHSISGIDPANMDESMQWDAGGNVVLTGGTILFKFS